MPKPKPLPPCSPEYLARWTYDPETGAVTRDGQVVGSRGHYGYLCVKFGELGQERVARLHRLAWFLTFDLWPDSEIDHINGVTDDNRLANLRLASRTENCWNQKTSKANKSGRKGVSWCKTTNKWRVKIGQRTVGRFRSWDEAVKAHEAAQREAYGDFVRSEDLLLLGA